MFRRNFELIVVTIVIFGTMALTGYTLKDSGKAQKGMVKYFSGK